MLSLILTVLVAGLTLSAMNGWILPFGLLRVLAIASFLASLLYVVYADTSSRVFAGGWAICSGISLMMIFAGVPIIGAFLRVSPDPHFGTVIDVAFSFVLAYLGGLFASRLVLATKIQNGGS